ncbi:MAG: hypothetical protein ABIT83_07925 [Massilia sp.]
MTIETIDHTSLTKLAVAGPAPRTRPDASEAITKADTSAAYDDWLRAEIQEAIDDPSPTISHEEVVRQVRAAIKGVSTKRAPA